MATLEENINQAIADFDDIEAAIEEKGVEVADGTDTSEYGNLIRSIPVGSDVIVDQTYDPASENAQSGTAVAEAIATVDSKIKYVESTSENILDLFSMESGTYVLYGKFRPYPNATRYLTFSKLQLVSVSKGSLSTCVQVFYPPYNAIQYLNIWADDTLEEGYTYERKDAKLYYMEDTRNMTNTVDENSDDTHYPSAKATYTAAKKVATETATETKENIFSKVFENKNLFNGEGIELVEGYCHYTIGGIIASDYYNYFSNITLKAGVEYTFYPKVRYIHDIANNVDIYGGKDETLYTYTPTEDVVVDVTVYKEDMETAKLFESQYQPSVVERYGFSQLNSNILNAPIKYVESLDENNILSLRDLDSGYYMLHGYFHPYPNSDSTLILDTIIAFIARVNDGSHILTISPLNFKFNLHEILVDDTDEDGFTYDSKSIRMWDFDNAVNDLETTVSEMKNSITLTDTATGNNYKLYVENGKLTMEVIE